jgi:outer membrane protein assembly factor BamB
VFVNRGNVLLALELETGEQRWAVSLGEFDETLRYELLRPMVSAHRVIVSVPRGVGAFDTATGKLLWSTQGHHASVVYGGRVYSQDSWKFGVLDLNDGRVLLETNPQSLVEKKWGFNRVEFHTGLAVSETHLFMGDGEGRLYAFEKETGEPVWYHRPKGGNPYFGNIPVIANNRLYIATVKPGPYTPTARTRGPGSLYCYEEAGS